MKGGDHPGLLTLVCAALAVVFFVTMGAETAPEPVRPVATTSTSILKPAPTVPTTTTTTVGARKVAVRTSRNLLGGRPAATGCAYEAQIRAAFPTDGDWAVDIAWRESRCQPDAVNWGETCAPGSHAHGLFQMCFPLHAPTFAAVGCADPLSADCNIRAAASLYQGSGRAPWRLG